MLRDHLSIMAYASALTADDNRPLLVVRGMERAIPGMRLEWTVSKERQLVLLPHRDEWIAQATERGEFPFLCNNDATHPVMISGLEHPPGTGPGGHTLIDVHGELPFDANSVKVAPAVLEAVAESASAFWGHLTPFHASAEIAQQTVHQFRPTPPRGLPALKPPDKLPSPEIPHRLGWLNYWSAAATRATGFPDPARDAELLSRARQTASGGWVVRLTDAPLDLDDPAHLTTLLKAYERFPVIGGRTTP